MVDVFSKRKRSLIMSKLGPNHSTQELIVRKLLSSMGYRFRLHRKDLPGTPDILIRKPKLLILDEATSGLDSGAEEALFLSLRSLSGPLTSFAISHRSSFSNIADTLYGIEAGEIKPLKKGPENRSML